MKTLTRIWFSYILTHFTLFALQSDILSICQIYNSLNSFIQVLYQIPNTGISETALDWLLSFFCYMQYTNTSLNRDMFRFDAYWTKQWNWLQRNILFHLLLIICSTCKQNHNVETIFFPRLLAYLCWSLKQLQRFWWSFMCSMLSFSENSIFFYNFRSS
jgi:hypothetical protein